MGIQHPDIRKENLQTPVWTGPFHPHICSRRLARCLGIRLDVTAWYRPDLEIRRKMQAVCRQENDSGYNGATFKRTVGPPGRQGDGLEAAWTVQWDLVVRRLEVDGAEDRRALEVVLKRQDVWQGLCVQDRLRIQRTEISTGSDLPVRLWSQMQCSTPCRHLVTLDARNDALCFHLEPLLLAQHLLRGAW